MFNKLLLEDLSAFTALPSLDCICAPCPIEIPKWSNTYIVKPEQSNPLGLAPPYTYGTPKNSLAYSTISLALALELEEFEVFESSFSYASSATDHANAA